MPGFYIENFGCRATQADGAAIENQLRERGLERCSDSSEAEIVVLNTCTVTASADQDARATIRRISRENPTGKIVVTGCYAQRAPDEIAALPGVSQVIGNSHKHLLAELLFSEESRHREMPNRGSSFLPLSQLNSPSEPSIFVSDIFAHTELLAGPVFDSANERTRPNLKIQDGCDNRCSFCVIPFVRGQSRSLPLPEIIDQVKSLIDSGYREVVISGINLGRWGRDLDTASSTTHKFENVIRAVLDETALDRLRVSSVEPMDWTDSLISLFADSRRIARHAHVPMQSGSDAVLRRMHRKYRPWHYREKIEKIRAALPDAAIGADVMVGFPGESDAEFEETRRLVEEVPLTYLHVFSYSARPGTPAAALGDQVPAAVARERNQILRHLGKVKKLAFMRSFVGKTLPAITLKSSTAERTEALTDNFLTAHLAGGRLSNQLIQAHVKSVNDGVLVATAN